jgi:cell division control protein 6
MDIGAYLAKQKQRIGQQTANVKAFDVFDFNYVPEQPLIREECKSIIDATLQFEAAGLGRHHAVIGARGCGKTLTMKYLQRVLPGQTQLQCFYANCRHHNTSYRLLGHMLEEPFAGASLQQLFDRFQKRCDKPTVVILDEIDLMSPKDKRREILYLLSRAPKPFMVVMLSNSPQVLKQLDAATRSSLQPTPLYFSCYDTQQLQQILRDRAERGLHRWDEADLARIAALTVRLANSDARVAIKTLYYSVTEPEDDLDSCFERARRDIVVDMIHDLADPNLIILYAAANGSSDLVKPIYDCYTELSQKVHQKPFSYVHFYANLSYLQSMGLIALASTKVDRTYTNRVILNFDPQIVRTLFSLRFEERTE